MLLRHRTGRLLKWTGTIACIACVLTIALSFSLYFAPASSSYRPAGFQFGGGGDWVTINSGVVLIHWFADGSPPSTTTRVKPKKLTGFIR